MQEVNIIISGEYSDWAIEGYTTYEYEAIQICANHNKSMDYEDQYYERVEKAGLPKYDIPLIYVHRFYAHEEGGKLVFDINSGNVEYYKDIDVSQNEEIKMDISSSLFVERFERKMFAWIYVSLKELNYDKARKIAQDKIAEYNYNHMVEDGGKYGVDKRKRQVAAKK